MSTITLTGKCSPGGDPLYIPTDDEKRRVLAAIADPRLRLTALGEKFAETLEAADFCYRSRTGWHLTAKGRAELAWKRRPGA